MLAQIVLFDGFDPLDVIAPFEVLSAGSDALGGALDVRLVAVDGPGLVTSGTRGLRLEATDVLRPEEPGFVIVPGASGVTEGDRTRSRPSRSGWPDSVPRRSGTCCAGRSPPPTPWSPRCAAAPSPSPWPGCWRAGPR